MTSAVIDAGDDLPLTIPALWRRQARKYAERALVADDGARLTYAEVDARSRRLARGLLAAGATKGSHVAVLFPNGADFLVNMLAVTRIGAVVVPLSTLSTADELRWLLTNSDTAFLLATPEFRSHRYGEMLQTAFPELDFSRPPPMCSLTAPWLRRIWFTGPIPKGYDAGWSVAALEATASTIDDTYLEAVEARVSPGDRLVIIHTSGSTSAPKGVIHAHASLIRHLDNINQVRRFTPDDVLFTTAPWFWVAGFAYSMLGTVVAGGRVVCSNTTSPTDTLDLLEREQPTMTSGYAPTVARLAADPSFAKRKLSSIRQGNLHPIKAADARPRDPALRHDVYGMSEAGGALSMSGDESDLPEHQRGSCGRFLPGFETKLVDADTGKECAQGEMGELWIRGPFMMEGYYGKPRSQVFMHDNWWRSGDIGTIDAEGFFYLKGRLGNMIKTSFANVAPREVEAAISELTGGTECFVIGLPDPQRGQAVTAILIADHDSKVDEAALKQKLATKLSSYKVPRRILRLSQAEIPLLSSGKVDMPKLKALAQERAQVSSPPS
ncbi:MAG: long-chain fatty acid--CoA ligase [Rhodospirillaceae bacterium]|nr:MAG: long-chain fatty acid--CoA ligase [Rhodospirillaceae bacterium]